VDELNERQSSAFVVFVSYSVLMVAVGAALGQVLFPAIAAAVSATLLEVSIMWIVVSASVLYAAMMTYNNA